MIKIIVLKLGTGSIATGFTSVVAELFQGSETQYLAQFQGGLPAASELAELQQRWQKLHAALMQRLSSRIEIISQGGVTQVSELEFMQLHQLLIQQFQAWLESSQFRPIDRKLRAQLSPKDEIQLLLESEDADLFRLPWHSWNFLEDYTQAEVALSWPERLDTPRMRSPDGVVRVLAVLGNSYGIDVKADSQLLKSLPDIDLVLLQEPTYEVLHNQLWDARGFDIFFFAGHSDTGQLRLNEGETLTLTELRYALNHAIAQGLQLAIFNSCEGLGLAHELADWQLPHSIVMRERVPDVVAQTFLKGFLSQFAQGKSLYQSVRQAREQLQSLEKAFPAASGLPILCQTPLSISPSWQSLRDKSRASMTEDEPRWKKRGVALLMSSLLTTAVVMGTRWLGGLQPLEFRALDVLMGQLPAEQADPRLLIVAIDEQDISPEFYGHPLSDAILAQLLETLESYNPSAIGLDIVRDQPVPPGHGQLGAILQTNKQTVTPCAFGAVGTDSIAPPPQSPEAQIGFVDLFDDNDLSRGDYTIRRYLLTRSANPIETPSKCSSPYSFAWQLAYLYLSKRKIPISVIGDSWQFGPVTIARLTQHDGGYQTLDDRGNQILMNYRRTTDPAQLAQQVTLRDVLTASEAFNPEWVTDRVVLIGIIAASDSDIHDTPFGKLSGVYVHAHAVSQLLSAVEDQRQLITWLPIWGDAGVIFLGAVIGSGVGLLPITLIRQLIITGGCLLALYIGSLLALMVGIWLPWLPVSLSLVSGLGVVQVLYTSRFLTCGSSLRFSN